MLLMALLVLTFLHLSWLAVLRHTHKVVDDVEIIVYDVPAGHDVLTVEQGGVIYVRRRVCLLEPTTTCSL